LSSHAIDVGAIAPAFSLKSVRGTADLTALKGKIVYVDFWASWCVPCKQSFPWMNEMQAKYGDRGFEVVAINVDAKQADADKFLAQIPAKFNVAFDSAGDTPKKFGVKAMPSAVIVGADGRVLHVHAGFRDSDKAALEAAIVAALDGLKKR
jgi:cytochrome c biogenesis protein CcmG, thiol:disulfide interchange protein DsbE